MRDILFRGKCATTGQWVYGYYNQWGYLHSIYFDSQFVLVIPETIGQWTGLLDNNRTKVFEGDILEAQDGIEVCKTVIYWDEDLAGFFDRRDLDFYSFTHFEGDMLWVKQRKIIGNIHESI